MFSFRELVMCHKSTSENVLHSATVEIGDNILLQGLTQFCSEMGENIEVWGKLYNEKISNFSFLTGIPGF